MAINKTKGLGSHLGNQTTVSAPTLIPIESSNNVKYTKNVEIPKLKITNLSYMSNTKCAENEHKL